MPIGYLDVPSGADDTTKARLVKALYTALHQAYPFPDDTRVFLREWPSAAISQNGVLDPEPAKPAFMAHVPLGATPEAKRVMVKAIDEAVRDAYGLPELITFVHEHSLELVAVDGVMLADDQQRVEDQTAAYASR